MPQPENNRRYTVSQIAPQNNISGPVNVKTQASKTRAWYPKVRKQTYIVLRKLKKY